MIVRKRDIDRLGAATIPQDGELHVWRFALDRPTGDVLSETERERAERYAIERPRRQFVAARGTLREILAKYLDCSARDVPLEVEPDGKPILSGSRLRFNVTHSGDLGLIVIGNRRVGIDLEQIRPVPNAAGLVDRFFGPEERDQFVALPDELKLEGFFRGWTCKEALLKAVGTGIQNVDKCVVDLDVRREPDVVRFDHPAELGNWRLTTWVPTPGYVAALAIECEEPLAWR